MRAAGRSSCLCPSACSFSLSTAGCEDVKNGDERDRFVAMHVTVQLQLTAHLEEKKKRRLLCVRFLRDLVVIYSSCVVAFLSRNTWFFVALQTKLLSSFPQNGSSSVILFF